VVMSEAKSEEKGGGGEQWDEGKEQGEGKDGVVDDEAEAKGERDDRVEIDQATLLDPFMPGDNFDEEGNPRSFSFEPGSLPLKATEFTVSRLEEVGSPEVYLLQHARPHAPTPPRTLVRRSGHRRRVSARGHVHSPGVRGACGGRATTGANGEGVHGHPRF